MSSASVDITTDPALPLGAGIKAVVAAGFGAKGPRQERPETEKTVQGIYNMFKKMGGGADGGVVGFNGSVKARCLVEGFNALGIKGKHLIDFGAGDGRVLLSAISVGASGATGYELPDNKGHKLLFDCVKQRCDVQGKNRAQWEAQDIDRMTRISEGAVVFTFWVGMPVETQHKILSLCARFNSPSLLVFRDTKWKNPDEILGVLEEHMSSGQRRRFAYLHCGTISMDMMGSNESKTAWVFERHERVRNPFVSEAKPRKRSKGGGDDDAMTVKKRKISEAE